MVSKDAADTLGLDGYYVDPLWRVQVELSPLERDLLRSWWVRRLAFVAHAGAASITTTQSYSRLEHSLGVLALVVHFAAEDTVARAAALLHDVGHLPFSHTPEGLAGLDHHALGHRRITELGPVLARHGLSAGQVIAVDAESSPSCLRGAQGRLTLDHLDSFLRSGQAHGRTQTAPAAMLRLLRLVGGGVDTDAATARELTRLIAAEARSQRSPANVTAVAVIRHLTSLLLDRVQPDTVAAMTDDELWCALLHDPETASAARRLRRAPHEWVAEPLEQAARAPSPSGMLLSRDGASGISYDVRRSYLNLPTVDGRAPLRPAEIDALAKALPLRYWVRPL